MMQDIPCPPPPPAPPSLLPPPPPPPAPTSSSSAKISPANLHKHVNNQSVSPTKSVDQAVDRFIKFNQQYSDDQVVMYITEYHPT